VWSKSNTTSGASARSEDPLISGRTAAAAPGRDRVRA
jgi:hypothetical protein